VLRFLIGTFLTGRRIQWVPALDGEWSEVLNGAGSVSCTVSLRNRYVKTLDLPNSATEGKSFLAAVDGDTVLQAGPIWAHEFDDDRRRLTLLGSGAWSYFDHRTILPYPTTDPADAAADTNLTSSLQGIARAWVEQSQGWPNGDVPVILPDEIPGDADRNEAGANLARVGERLSQITEVEGGPEIQFKPRFQENREGVEWVMRIGTPDEPRLFSPQDVIFRTNVPESSVSGLRVRTSGTNIASRVYASGGRTSDTVLIRYAENPGLLAQGFPALDAVDASFQTVTEADTMQAHANDLRDYSSGRVVSVSFDHSILKRPYVYSFTVGDFARVHFTDHPYFGTGVQRMRIVGRRSDAQSKKVRLDLQPEYV
jgi:hypothetical protein